MVEKCRKGSGTGFSFFFLSAHFKVSSLDITILIIGWSFSICLDSGLSWLAVTVIDDVICHVNCQNGVLFSD